MSATQYRYQGIDRTQTSKRVQRSLLPRSTRSAHSQAPATCTCVHTDRLPISADAGTQCKSANLKHSRFLTSVLEEGTVEHECKISFFSSRFSHFKGRCSAVGSRSRCTSHTPTVMVGGSCRFPRRNTSPGRGILFAHSSMSPLHCSLGIAGWWWVGGWRV